MALINGYSRTQRNILRVLADGEPHSYAELFDCLPDADGAKIDYCTGINALRIHITTIRGVLKPKGEYIICEAIGYKKHYRHVKLLVSPVETPTQIK